MEPLQDWRSPKFEEELSRLDRGGVAFEFLRRNKSYRADYMEAREGMDPEKAGRAEAIAHLSQRWGVTFPGRPVLSSPDLPPDMATATFPCHHYRRACPGRL